MKGTNKSGLECDYQLYVPSSFKEGRKPGSCKSRPNTQQKIIFRRWQFKNIAKEKVAKSNLATLNKHEDIKREYKKKLDL